MEKKTISAAEAAKILGVTPQKVRERMKSGAWDIGIASKSNGTYRYDVFTDRLRRMMEGT